MMSNILICTIIRNRINSLDSWFRKINSLVDMNNIGLSVYENDSDDGSSNWLSNIKNDSFIDTYVQSEKIATNYYGSIMNADRVKNLAIARNKCIDIVEDLSKYDKLIFIEPDVEYEIIGANRLIDISKKYDILSGYSIGVHGFYDTWATRSNITHQAPPNGNNYLITDKWGGIHPVASTFGGFCIYNIQPFIDGARFTSEMYGSADCDTACICDTFANMGYDNIAIDRSFIIRH
jgi:hypothetical protein|tara:strand:- start:202 stop:906 length:705 start_codon:yes stop_codon:yes gene_type:complete